MIRVRSILDEDARWMSFDTGTCNGIVIVVCEGGSVNEVWSHMSQSENVSNAYISRDINVSL